MRRLLFIVTAFFAYSLAMEKQSDSHNKGAELLPAVSSFYHEEPKEKVSANLISDLIRQNSYGPVLAKLLDSYYKDYTYQGAGVYTHLNREPFHNIPRHLCEEGATKEEAKAKNNEFEPLFRNFTCLHARTK